MAGKRKGLEVEDRNEKSNQPCVRDVLKEAIHREMKESKKASLGQVDLKGMEIQHR